MVSEGWGNLNGALTEVVNDKSSRVGKLVGALVRGHTVDDDVVLGPGYDDEVKARSDEPHDPADVVVLASGNLGLISFTKIKGRATFEELRTRYPGLLAGLAEHPGIGFILVHSENLGPLAVGGTGIRYLVDDRVEGKDPLANFGPNCADHLRRTSSFVNAPDILVNSFFDPHADEGAAFEELIGFHGGLGGEQSMPFILHPAVFPVPDGPIVGAATVHHLFKGWLAGVQRGRTRRALDSADRGADRTFAADRELRRSMDDSPTNVTWIGHSTILVDVGGYRVITDPLLTRRVAHLRRRRPLPPADHADVDLTLLSHIHLDHLHLPSIRQLRPIVRVRRPPQRCAAAPQGRFRRRHRGGRGRHPGGRPAAHRGRARRTQGRARAAHQADRVTGGVHRRHRSDR